MRLRSQIQTWEPLYTLQLETHDFDLESVTAPRAFVRPISRTWKTNVSNVE